MALLAACSPRPVATAEQLAAQLPRSVGDRELHVAPLSAQDVEQGLASSVFERAFEAAGESRDGAVAASATGRFVSILAYRPGRVSADRLLETYVESRVAEGGIAATQPRELAGRRVVELRVAHGPDCSEPCIDRLYVYTDGQTLFLIQVADEATAEAILEQLR